MSQQSNPATLREGDAVLVRGEIRRVYETYEVCAVRFGNRASWTHVPIVDVTLATSGTEAAPDCICSDDEHSPECPLAQAAASPEGEGREADDVHALFEKWWDFAEATLAVDLKGMARDAFCAGWACGEAALRQSAAPSGPLDTPSKLDGSMATAPSDLSAIDYEKSYASFAAMPNEVIASRTVGQLILAKGKLDVYKAILTKLVREIRKEWLPGETGAVTETK